MNILNTLEKKVLKKVTEVVDPELFVSIVELGLVYKVEITEKTALITMTLTTIGCPLFSIIERQVESQALKVKGVEAVKIELTFDPPWNMEMMSEAARAMLCI